MTDFDAIRQRDAVYMSGGPALTDEKMDAARRASADRHDLLAEIDRLRAEVEDYKVAIGSWSQGMADAMNDITNLQVRLDAAQPVIEEARSLTEARLHGGYDATWNWDDLYIALAQYGEVTK